MRKYLFMGILAVVSVCCTTAKISLSEQEIALIDGSGDVMRVLTIDNPGDSLVLRSECAEFNAADLKTPEYAALAGKMAATMTSPEQDGVGIAGPQVGILRRIIVVQRFDKEGEPVEVYANPYIVETRGEKEAGPEGCLSIPGRRGDVMRWRDITVVYANPLFGEPGQPQTISEDVSGYTAIIFQHEIDHLSGVLYIDKLQ